MTTIMEEIALDTREFEYLIAIAENRSITKAANQLFMTQSALSKFVQKKEAEMGTILFNRDGKRCIPTLAGEKCIEAAKKIQAVSRQLSEDVVQIAEGHKGRICLGFHSSLSDFFLSKVYPVFQTDYPDIEIKIYELSNHEVLNMVEDAQLDIALATTTWIKHEVCNVEPLRMQNIVIAVRQDSPLIARAVQDADCPHPVIDIRELVNVPLILQRSEMHLHKKAIRILNAAGITPQIVLETGSRDNSLRAVEYGLAGATFTFNDPAYRLIHKNITYLSFKDDEEIKSYLCIIHNERISLSLAGKALWIYIKEQYGQIVCNNDS
jgi:DNA-binding transcriptional LysR family regulator